MNEEIGLDPNRVFDDFQKIFENRLGPIHPALGIALGGTGDLKPEMCICGQISSFFSHRAHRDAE